MLDSRPRGRGFEPHRHHCVVSLSKNINPSLVLVQPRKTRPFITEFRKIVDGMSRIKPSKGLLQLLFSDYISYSSSGSETDMFGFFFNPHPANIFCPENVICLLHQIKHVHLLHIFKYRGVEIAKVDTCPGTSKKS